VIALTGHRDKPIAGVARGSLHGFGVRIVVAVVMVGVLGCVAFALGVPLAGSAGVAAASVGTWYLGLASHELRILVCGVMRRLGSRVGGLGADVVAAAGAGGGFVVCLAAVVLAAVVHAGSPVVFGVSGVVVGNVILTGTERARATEAADRRREPASAPMVGRTARVSAPRVSDASVVAS